MKEETASIPDQCGDFFILVTELLTFVKKNTIIKKKYLSLHRFIIWWTYE